MNSHTGLKPLNAAPTHKPANPASVMGVSITRFSPAKYKRTIINTWQLQTSARSIAHLI